MRLALAVASLLLAVAGCGGDDATTSSDARMYLLRDGLVWPVSYEVEGTDDVEVTTSAVEALVAGEEAEDVTELGLTNAIPAGAEVVSLNVDGGVVRLELSEELSREALAQVVYTATQTPGLDAVEISGERYTRADFEEQTPHVLVETPLAFEDVTSPIRATGTANTYEATFNYEVTDTDGRIVDDGFVTATSGTGTRGTFDFTTDEFAIPFDGVGALIVYEVSAEDGSRMNVVEIPLRMSQ